MIWFRRHLWLWLVVVCAAPLASASAEARELRAIAEVFPTIAEVAPDGSLRGVGVEIVRQIATTLAWYYGSKFNDHQASLALDPSVRQPDAFRMLVRGRVDLVITTESAGQAAVEQLGIAGLVTELSPPVDILDGHIGFAKSPEMVAVRQAFDRELATLVADGTVARLNQKYGRFY